MKKKYMRRYLWIIFSFFVMTIVDGEVQASLTTEEVEGILYEFDEDTDYEFDKAEITYSTNDGKPYGLFKIEGQIKEISEKEDIPAFELTESNLSFSYTYNDVLLNAAEEEWHLVEDEDDEIDYIELEEDIKKGAIIVQTSKDKVNWNNVQCITNAFADMPMRTENIYEATEVELFNGCFYRVIVVYELGIKVDTTEILFVEIDDYEYKRYAEVYEFYAIIDTGENREFDSAQTYNLGSKVKVDDFDGYFGETEIDKDDNHYGWDLGQFFVSGYTDKVIMENESVVFLKNVGDRVALWFRLDENIDAIQGDNDLTVTEDEEGYDQYFETPKMDFGRGVLIIRYTDYNNIASEPIIYTNYLDANVTLGTDTMVQLFEEGDYEVALDYEITEEGLIDSEEHYRIYFEFSIRNGNCMVYPFDVVTGSELTNSSMTENGFRLDLAKSRYLKVNLKREVLTDSADGLVEDTRFNGPAKDGAEYIDEGIYTITVSNEYTNQTTEKKIYVGSNNILKAHMTYGYSVPEINEMVANGAEISDDGIITLAADMGETEESSVDKKEESVPVETIEEQEKQATEMARGNDGIYIVIAVVGFIVIGAVVGGYVSLKKKRKDRTEE